jgi:DNA-binding NtrC family response regulator
MKKTAPHQRRTIRSPPGPVARQNDPNGSAVVKEEALHIFVVDDEKVISETLAAILRLSGFAATSFTNPFEALNARSGSPDLLLSDVVMPGLSGVDLAIQFKEKYPNCKVLLFSGQAATNDLLQAARERGHDFHLLTKPVHPVDLLQRIKRLI